tara:strand:- start:967 stop:1350 length:384 start_codon:yes stop_codon:yes gene_type:complete
MSVNKCYGVPNNVYNNFPGVMNDGSIFTSHKPSGSFNSAIRKAENINNNSDYRKYLQNNAVRIMDFNKQYAYNFNCYFDYNKKTEVVKSGTPYVFTSKLDKNKPFGYNNSDLKELYLSKDQLNKKLS